MPSRSILVSCVFVLAAAGLSCQSPERGGKSDKSEQKPSIILIVVDSLRKDHLSAFGYSRPTSPTLDSLFRQGILFERSLAQAPQTVPSVVSLLTGLFPTQTGLQFYSHSMDYEGDDPRPPRERSIPIQRGMSEIRPPRVPDALDLLPEALARAGYDTWAVTGNPWMRPEYGFAQGFAHYAQLDCVPGKAASEKECAGEATNRAAAAALAALDSRPTFLYVHYMDVHAPYEKPFTRGIFVRSPARARYANGPAGDLTEKERDYLVDLYDEAVLHADASIGALLGEVGRKVLDRTIVAVVPDHGEEFHEHGGLGHGTGLHGELVDCFLFLRYPPRLAPARRSGWVRHIDLAPALFDLAGLGAFPAKGGGRILAPARGARAPEPPGLLLAELGDRKTLIEEPWKLVVNLLGASPVELYDLSTDREERVNVATRNPERAGAMETRLLRILGRLGREAPVEPAPAPIADPETLERLHSLGYVKD